MIDRYLLRYFIAVIEEGNFSRAAAKCNVSQPTLSVGIAKLERILDRTLFNRTNRRVQLTPAGVTFASHARRIEAEFLAATEALRDARERPLLRLGVLTTIPDRNVCTALKHVLNGGRFAIELMEGREGDLTGWLTGGRIDAALTIIPAGSARFTGMPLLTEGYSLALPVAHPLADHAVIDASALADSPMIVRRTCERLADTSRHFTSRGVRPPFVARTASDARALELVRSGLGVTVMPDSYVCEGVVRPRLADFAFERTLGLLFADGDRSRQPGAAQAFDEIAGAVLSSFAVEWS